MGPGDELGEVVLKDGTTVHAFFRRTWNAASFDESQKSALPNLLFHKNRNSGTCEAMTDCT